MAERNHPGRALADGKEIRVVFIDARGVEVATQAAPGTTLLRAALDAGVAGVAGDCGGSCQCAACHALLDIDYYPRIPAPGSNELQMLEAQGHRGIRSRLLCQVTLDEAIDGLRVTVPRRA